MEAVENLPEIQLTTTNAEKLLQQNMYLCKYGS